MRGKTTERSASRAHIEERFLRDWWFELPDSIFRFSTFLGSLDLVQDEALRDLEVSPAGIMDGFTDASLQPCEEGIDVRVHGRYYRDPPEFLTFMHAGSDGLHHGLWFDDGRTCRGVASYYNNDGGGIDTTSETPLEALRAILERCWRDLDDVQDEETSARRSRLSRLRDALTVVETGDRPEVGIAYSSTYDAITPPVDLDQITTLDGAGTLVGGVKPRWTAPPTTKPTSTSSRRTCTPCSRTRRPCRPACRRPADAAPQTIRRKPWSWAATCTAPRAVTQPARHSPTNSSWWPTARWTVPRWRR